MQTANHFEMLDDEHAAILSPHNRSVTYLKMDRGRWIEDAEPPIVFTKIDWDKAPDPLDL